MEKTIKYLENGEYHYATVKDVGDLAKLKTDSKDDLVTAINELFITGGEASKKPDGYDELVDNVADAIQKQQQMTDTITNMQQSAQLSDAEMQHMKQVQEEAHQDYIKALKEFNDAIAQANADALELDKKTDELKKNADDLNKKTNDLQDKLNETFTKVGNEVSAVHKQLDAESAGLHKELNDTKASLEATRKDLLNNTQEFGVVNSEVKELKDKMDRRIWSTDLDPVREQVNKNTTEVSQTKDELKNKADQSNLDLVTNSVENLSTQVKENAAGLKVSVKKDELGGDVARLLNDKTNLLLGTRNFSGDSWGNKTFWHEEAGYWKGLKVFSSTEIWFGLQYKYEVKQGQQYTFSFWARQEKDNSSAGIVLSESNKGDQGITTPYTRGVYIGTEWKRYSLTFQVVADGIIYPRVEQNVQGNKLYIAGYKLELGSVATPWEPNEADVAENIEHNESQFNVYSDQIAGIVKKQEKMGDTERQLDTRITETAEGLKQTSKDLQDANGKITEFKGQLESTARGLKTEYEKYTNDAIGQISDSSLNLIRNSSFSNGEDELASWQNVSAKATVKEDNNNLHWIELTQTGQSTDNPIGITSNYFIVKQGKVTVAVDIKLGDKANLDNQNILLLELYNDNKQRVDFTDVSVSQLGLSTAILNDHNVHRGLYRLGIDREDVKYMTVKAILHRNGDLYFTNFSARLSSIDDGGYEPNPDDINQQILKMNTKIEEDAKHIALKANSVDVTRVVQESVGKVDNRLTNEIGNMSNQIDSKTKALSDKVNNIRVGGRNLLTGTQEWQGEWGNLSRWQVPVGEETYAGLAVRSFPAAWWGLGQYYDAKPNTTYTFSFYAKTSEAGNFLDIFVLDSDDWSSSVVSIPDYDNLAITTEWQRYSVTFTTKSGGKIFPSVCSNKDGITIYVAGYKLEEGTIPTSWSPAPEDTSAEIKSAKDAAIQVASDQINIHVNELTTSFDDKLNKRVNEVKTASEKFTSDGIEQTVTKITNVKNDVDRLGDTVDGIQVGGRNYLQNSDKSITGWAQDLGTIPNATLNELAGKTITVSADVEWNNFKSDSALQNRLGFELTVSGNDGRGYWLGAWKYPKTSSGKERISTTYTLPQGVTFTVVNNGQNGYVSINGSGKVSHVKIEIGNRMTDWSPAPEDINQSIKDATEYKTVTGTIDFNNLKTQQKIFYKDVQATNAPAGGNYWYYLDVKPGTDGRIFQTAISDRDNITWVRTFVDGWSPWVKQADQRNVDDLNNQISSFKTETTASVKNLGDRVTTEVNSVTSKINNVDGKVNNMKIGGRNLLKGTRDFNSKYWYQSGDHTGLADNPTDSSTKEIHSWLDWHSFINNQTIQLEPSKNYMISADITIYDGDGNGLYVAPYGTVDGQTSNLASTDVNLAGFPRQVKGEGFRRIYLPVTAHGRTLKDFRIEGHGNWNAGGGSVFISKIALYEGNTPMAWSDASDDFVEAIKKLNTKWDVANGQIQGKVTATDVNNILNGKGYATQSWAQTMFTMKSDAITLQAVRDNITNGIQNQVNDTRNQVKGLQNQFNTQTGINLLKGTADFSGSWFNKDANGWSIMSGWQAPFSENTSAMNNNVVYVKNGSAWNGLGQAVQLNPGEYTFSMWLWPDLSGKESLSIYAGDGQYGGTATLSCGYTYSASQPQKQWVLAKLYLNVTKGGVVAIRPELNQDTGKMYVASYMLQRGHVENPTWAPNPGDLSPSNIVSAINLTPDDIKLASKKINIDGNTGISGTLNVPTVRLQGKSGQIDLSGDSGISIKDSSGGKVDIGASGVNIFSGMQTVNTDFADKSGFKLNVGSSGVEFSNVLHQTNGIMGAGQHEYGFLKIEPAVLPGTNTQETQYNAPAGIIGYVENMPDASLGPMSPGGFLALGSRTRKDTNVNSPVEDKTEIVYANKALNGWDQGLTIRSQFFIKPQDADHGIRSAWVSWSAWDHGEKYPAFVNDSGAWGGICFPRSGRVTLFDSGGQYYTPDRSTGVGPYDNYWTKGQ